MKYFLTTLFIACSLTGFGQFCIVSDKEGSVNVREDGQQNSKITDRLENGHLVYCMQCKGNWENIDYTKNGKELNGYIYKDRCRSVDDFSKFKISPQTGNSITLKKDSFTVTLYKARFNKAKHKFSYVKQYPDQIEKIDNKKYWGKDGGMPNTQYEKIEIRIGQRTITLPRSATEGLYEPNIDTAEVNYDPSTDSFYIQTMNSDGAGSYEIMWRVEKGIYKDRLVAYGF